MKMRLLIISAVLLTTLGIVAYSGSQKAQLTQKCNTRLTQVNLLMHFGYDKHLVLKELTNPIGDYRPCKAWFANRIPKELK